MRLKAWRESWILARLSRDYPLDLMAQMGFLKERGRV